MTQPVLARKARQGEPGFSPNPKECGRVYEHPVTRMVAPSITAIDGMLDKPALKFWFRNQVAEYAAENLSMLDERHALGLSKADIVKELKTLPFESDTDSPAKIGDQVHDAIDHFIKTGEHPSAEVINAWSLTAARMWGSFLAFNAKYSPEWLESEFTVWTEKHNYAGTGDWICRIGHRIILGDTKTGNSTYPEVGLQVSALANADYILEPDGRQRPLPVFTDFAVLHVRPTFARLSPLHHIDECFETFKALRQVKRWKDFSAPSVIGDAPKIMRVTGESEAA